MYNFCQKNFEINDHCFMSFFIKDDSKDPNVLELLFLLFSLQDTFADKPISHNFPLNFVRCHDCPEKREQLKAFKISCRNVFFVRVNGVLNRESLRQGDKKQNSKYNGPHALSVEKGLVTIRRNINTITSFGKWIS